ncbi:hypothetical protein KVR01_007054 [Diaporthe batatas]|uniref:uncharacterized protein n=1 Tax=Diaporthe batatas TaxID=748121 RepID=UPI001D052F6F|nr:uncharacterized protein KVR01_007054 [Diaporthe batatas]KAG8163757.1 hypothetical protein KVR01_007054 [Diaporthe batatas]
MASAVINPAFVPLGRAFGITPVQASYELTVYIVFGGVGPLLVVPFANIYGRRPIYLGGNLLAAIANIVAGNCSTWGGVLATRAFSGIGAGSTIAIGAATICDLYFLHQRGFFMGIFTFFLTNGPHIAPLIGGFTAQNLGWRYCFTIPAYIQFALFCYKAQSAEISTLLNLFRHIFSAFLSFYAIPLGEKIQFQYAWLIFALLTVALMLPMGVLRVYGEKIRSSSWQKPPNFHKDL